MLPLVLAFHMQVPGNPCGAEQPSRRTDLSRTSIVKTAGSPEHVRPSMATKTRSKKRSTKSTRTKASTLAVPRSKQLLAGADERFAEVIALIEKARARGYQAVNTVLVGHYWELGAYISKKIATAEWGDGVVEDLAADLARR